MSLPNPHSGDGTLSTPESWLDKKGLARHLACSVRSIEFAIVDGMPHTIIFGRVKFRASEVEIWLERNGRLERRGETVDTPSDDKMAGRRVTATRP